jgi:hypothetical protein
MIDLRAMNWKAMILIILLFAGALLAGRFLGQQQEQAGEFELLAPLRCEPRTGPCVYSLPGEGEIHFSLEPRDSIQPMEPLTATLSYSGEEMMADALVLTGINMEMGHNQFNFRKTDDGYTAMVMIPVCTLSRMEWQALVRLTIEGERLAVPFRFAVERQ